MKNVVILADEGEYEADVTMRAVADRIAAQGDVHIDHHTPDVLEDQPAFPSSSFGDPSC